MRVLRKVVGMYRHRCSGVLSFFCLFVCFCFLFCFVFCRYNKRAGVVTGALQIFASGLLVLFGIVALVLGSYFRIGWNIWGSLGVGLILTLIEY